MNKSRNYIEQKYYELSYLFEVFSKEDFHVLELKGLVEYFDSKAKFIFVGVISVRNIAFIVLPKILKETTNLIEDRSLTLKTLQKYSYKNTQLFEGVDYFNVEPDDPECSELAIADYLLNDYEKNGLYFTQEQIHALNADGHIDWNSTIQDLDPIFNNSQPIYADTFNHIILNSNNHLIIEIHKWSLGYCKYKFANLLNKETILQFDFEEEITTLGELDDLLNALYKQLQISYKDREIHLIKCLIYLIRKKASPIENDLSLFGTRKFENIWEKICKTVINTKLGSSSFFPNPIWNILGKTYKSGGTLIPDIILEDTNDGSIYLFDAKYYSLRYFESLSGAPSYKDILKQFQYQQHLEQKAKKRISNAFLFPISHTEFESLSSDTKAIFTSKSIVVIGSVQYELYENKKIWVIMCSYHVWQKMYLENKFIDYSDIYWSL